mmetsp:Transcript_6107/g.11198  ORF Transcript_6107/g.11198 Transcript_6107/m.11198 type:complete len:305 (-) Transcript_6107:225-1139(-)
MQSPGRGRAGRPAEQIERGIQEKRLRLVAAMAAERENRTEGRRLPTHPPHEEGRKRLLREAKCASDGHSDGAAESVHSRGEECDTKVLVLCLDASGGDPPAEVRARGGCPVPGCYSWHDGVPAPGSQCRGQDSGDKGHEEYFGELVQASARRSGHVSAPLQSSRQPVAGGHQRDVWRRPHRAHGRLGEGVSHRFHSRQRERQKQQFPPGPRPVVLCFSFWEGDSRTSGLFPFPEESDVPCQREHDHGATGHKRSAKHGPARRSPPGGIALAGQAKRVPAVVHDPNLPRQGVQSSSRYACSGVGE